MNKISFRNRLFRNSVSLEWQRMTSLALFLVGALEEKCPIITAGSLLIRVWSTFLFICSTA